jgi:predicted dehydrogenase
VGGFRDILVTQPDHPFSELWWPPGHPLAWEHSFVHQWRDFLSAIIEERPISPEQATFADGYEAAVLCDAIITSAREGRRVALDEMRKPIATTD